MRVPSFLVIVAAVGVSAAAACSGGGAKPTDGPASLDARTDTPPASDAVDRPANPGGNDAGMGGSGGDASVGPLDAADGVAPGNDTGGPGDGSDVALPAARTVGEIYCPPGVMPAADPLPADRRATLVPISPPGGISFLEGPLWIAERGVLLFSEWNAGHRILQLTPPQAVEVFMPATGSNGLALAPDGKTFLMVTEVPSAGVSRVSLADKSVQKLVANFNGQGFMQPNDLVVRADGIIYFTDYAAGRLYRRALDGTLSMVSSLPRSNGVGLSPDEKTLYLNADTHTVKYPLAADGTAGAGTDLATGLKGADGLAIDCAGNVYIAQNMGAAVVVMSAAGAKLGEITGLPVVVTNAAFGGPDRKTLYITTSSALYTLPIQVSGLPY